MNGIEILTKHKLRSTGVRSSVVNLFVDTPYALSHADIELALGENYDRVTIYRTLNSFEESGIIHKVPADGKTARYALCQESCSSHHHNHTHIHFNCAICKQTFCLNEVTVPTIALPNGFKVNDYNFVASGVCKTCNLA